MGGALCYLFCAIAAAQGVAASPADRTLELQRREQNSDAISRELRENQLRQQSSPTMPPAASPSSAENVAPGQKFMINEVELDTQGEEPGSELLAIAKAHQGTMMGNAEIFELVRQLTNRLFADGYVTTAVIPAKGNLSTGRLVLRIDWGRVQGLTVNGRPAETGSERRLVAMLMPGIVGRVLNIRDVDQMIENLNNVAKGGKVTVVPAEEAGYSVLNIELSPGTLPHFTGTLTNPGDNGAASHGQFKGAVNARFGDVLLPNDDLSIDVSDRYWRSADFNVEQSYGFGYAVPVGRWIFETRLSQATYKTLLKGNNNNYQSTGWSQDASFKASYVLERTQTGKVTGFGFTNFKQKHNFIEGQLIDVSSGRYATVGGGANTVQRVGNAQIYSDLAVELGTGGSTFLGGAFSNDGEDAALRRITSNSRLTYEASLGSRPVSYVLTSGLQYSDQQLASPYKMMIGDEFTVRGFRNPVLQGDKGLYVSATLNMPFLIGEGDSAFSLVPFVGLDGGIVKNNYVSAASHSAASTVAGFRFMYRNTSLQMFVGHPFLVPSGIGRKPVVTFRASVAI